MAEVEVDHVMGDGHEEASCTSAGNEFEAVCGGVLDCGDDVWYVGGGYDGMGMGDEGAGPAVGKEVIYVCGWGGDEHVA